MYIARHLQEGYQNIGGNGKEVKDQEERLSSQMCNQSHSHIDLKNTASTAVS